MRARPVATAGVTVFAFGGLKKGDRSWVAAETPRNLSVGYAAIVPPGSTIRVEPDGIKPFVLYR